MSDHEREIADEEFMGVKSGRGRPRAQRQGVLDFEYELVDEGPSVTGRAGLPLVLDAWRGLSVKTFVDRHLEVRQRSRGYTEAEHLEAICLLLAAGGERLDDMAVLGKDEGLLQLLAKKSLPSPDATRRFLYAFHDESLLAEARKALKPDEKALIAPESAPLSGLARVITDLVRHAQRLRPVESATLEMDATIIESTKREALWHYDGGRGYQPALAYWVEQDLIVADEFRDGNVPAGKRPVDLIARAFAGIPETVQHRRFRADSACYESHVLRWVLDPQNRIERFTISADMTQELRAAAESVPDSDWQLYRARATENVYVAEIAFTAGDLPKDSPPLRTLVRKIVPEQGELFWDGASVKYLAVVSNDFEANADELLSWHDAKAGSIEHVHDVTKNELGAGTLPCGRLGANAAWYRLVTLTYNVLSLLKRHGLPKLIDARPKRLRFLVFNIPASLVTHSRRLLAKIRRQLAEHFDALSARRALLILSAPS